MVRSISVICALFLMAMGVFASDKPASSPTVVFWEEGFPAVDTASPVRADLAAALPGAAFAGAQELPQLLADANTRLLILPYGSAFPEEDWVAIYEFLQRGGNLLTLGGRPFLRAAYREPCATQPCAPNWKLRPERNAYARRLLINDYTETPGRRGLQFQANEEYSYVDLPRFDWPRAWSLTVKLSGEDAFPREGSAGTMDARLDTLVWGMGDGRKRAAPLVELDHFKNNFVGGRWVLLACELPPGFFSSAPGKTLLGSLRQRALQGAEEFTVRPRWALFLPGEPLGFEVRWSRFGTAAPPARVELTIAGEGSEPTAKTFDLAPAQFPFFTALDLPESSGEGLQEVTARLLVGGETRGIYHTGFWMRDERFLRSGPRVSVNQDYFEIDGRPLPVVGTTYMASDVPAAVFHAPESLRLGPRFHRDAPQWDEHAAHGLVVGLGPGNEGWGNARSSAAGDRGLPDDRAQTPDAGAVQHLRLHPGSARGAEPLSRPRSPAAATGIGTHPHGTL